LEELSFEPGSGFWDKNGIQGSNAFKNTIEESQVFYFGEMTKYTNLMPKGSERTTVKRLPKLPFDKVIYEYTHINKIAYMDLSTKPDVKQRIAVLLENIKEETVNCVALYSFFENGKYLPWQVYPISVGFNEQNITSKNFQLFNVLGSETTKEEDDILSVSLISFFNETCVFTDILNCQNVVTKDVLPTEKLNQKRIRNGKLPLYSYKILEVVKGKPRTKNAGSVPWDYKSPEAVRFHLCRGHFKTFTEERPLFGKYSGTFWWNPQSRGDRSKGAIEKEYSVKQFNSEAV
jgi:hypothetical protein